MLKAHTVTPKGPLLLQIVEDVDMVVTFSDSRAVHSRQLWSPPTPTLVLQDSKEGQRAGSTLPLRSKANKIVQASNSSLSASCPDRLKVALYGEF